MFRHVDDSAYAPGQPVDTYLRHRARDNSVAALDVDVVTWSASGTIRTQYTRTDTESVIWSTPVRVPARATTIRVWTEHLISTAAELAQAAIGVRIRYPDRSVSGGVDGVADGPWTRYDLIIQPYGVGEWVVVEVVLVQTEPAKSGGSSVLIGRSGGTTFVAPNTVVSPPLATYPLPEWGLEIGTDDDTYRIVAVVDGAASANYMPVAFFSPTGGGKPTSPTGDPLRDLTLFRAGQAQLRNVAIQFLHGTQRTTYPARVPERSVAASTLLLDCWADATQRRHRAIGPWHAAPMGATGNSAIWAGWLPSWAWMRGADSTPDAVRRGLFAAWRSEGLPATVCAQIAVIGSIQRDTDVTLAAVVRDSGGVEVARVTVDVRAAAWLVDPTELVAAARLSTQPDQPFSYTRRLLPFEGSYTDADWARCGTLIAVDLPTLPPDLYTVGWEVVAAPGTSVAARQQIQVFTLSATVLE